MVSKPSHLALERVDAFAWGGPGWLGWRDGTTARNSRCGLVVRDRPKDSPNQQEEEVTVESVPAVSLAVRCVAGLRAGKILSAGVTNHDLQHQGPLEITLGKLRYRLHLEAKDPYVADAKVMLAHTAGEHRCCTRLTDLADEPHFEIIWAGNLGPTGKLDLVVNVHRHYGWHPSPSAPVNKSTGQAFGR